MELRDLQEHLASIGVSSLGRSETHVLANVDKVLGILHRLCDRPWQSLSAQEPVGLKARTALLARHAEALFGAPPAARGVRIMITLPSTAATDPSLIASLVAGGMDIARINCAHDDASVWITLAQRVRAEARLAGRTLRVLMDLGGPKLRTGAIADAPAVIKLKPERDEYGRVYAPARLRLHVSGAAPADSLANPGLAVDGVCHGPRCGCGNPG